MLTRQGWLVVWGGVVLLVAGRVLGIPELYVFGTAALLLALLAALWVHLSRLDLQIERRVHPARVHAGTTSRVEIAIRNLRRRPSPVLRLRDPISGRDSAEVLVPPLGWIGTAAATYRLPTDRRGIHKIGPLEVVVTDPYGLARSSITGAEQVEVTVYPRIDDIQPVPFTLGHDPLAGTVQRHALGRSGDDFYALRPYVVGDDLRQIHWPSTARHDELLVRQQEQPWQGRTTVVLDVRRDTHDPQSLEVAVSAAASILHANTQRNDIVRMVTTDGTDSGFAVGRAHLEGMLEHLAVVGASPTANLRAVLDLLHKGYGGALVLVVARIPGEETGAIARLGRRYGSLTVVQVDQVTSAYWRAPRAARHAGGWSPQPAAPAWSQPAASGASGAGTGNGATGGNGQAVDLPLVPVSDREPFAVAWNRFVGRRAARTAHLSRATDGLRPAPQGRP
jgi:uncharacterized protein (DUF58 family)